MVKSIYLYYVKESPINNIRKIHIHRAPERMKLSSKYESEKPENSGYQEMVLIKALWIVGFVTEHILQNARLFQKMQTVETQYNKGSRASSQENTIF